MNDDFLKQCANIYFVDTPASDIKPEIYNSLRQKVMENKRQKQEKRRRNILLGMQMQMQAARLCFLSQT